MAIQKITFLDKVSTIISSLPIINRIRAEDVNEIKSVVNTNADLMGDLTNLTTNTKTSIVGAINELVNKATVYTTSEQEIGRWTDGRIIYRKVLTGNTPTNKGAQTADLTDVTKIIRFEVYVESENGYDISNNYAEQGVVQVSLALKASATNNVYWGTLVSAYYSKPYVIIVDYLKES